MDTGQFDAKSIFELAKSLGLKQDEYVVVGSGVVVALGLAEFDNDVDMIVSQKRYDQFTAEGWEQEDFQDIIVLKNGAFDVGVKFHIWELKDLQEDALVINDVPFLNPSKLLEWKIALGRPEQQLRVLRDYLETV